MIRITLHYLLAISLLLSLPATSVGNESLSVGKLTEIDSKRISALSLPDEQGNLNTTQFMNQVTLLHFWATWCVPCKKELPELVALKKKFNNYSDFKIITVAMDNPDLVKQYIKKHKLELNVLVDQFGKGLYHYKVDAIPKTYIIDKNARLRYMARGYISWSDDAVQNPLIKLLQE